MYHDWDLICRLPHAFTSSSLNMSRGGKYLSVTEDTRYRRWVSSVIIVVANQFIVKAMSHIHASAQHLAGRMRAFTGDPRAFLIRLSERQAGTLARRKLLPSKKGSLPCSWKQTFHILLRKCFGFGRQKSLFLTKCAKSLLSRFVCWSRPCCRSFLCVFRCLTSIISILPDPRAYEPLVSLITSQQATQDLNWAGITAPSAWQRRLCGRFQEKSHNNLSGDASALIFFVVVLFCELLTGKNILHPCRLESFTDVIGFTECKKIKVFFQYKHFTSAVSTNSGSHSVYIKASLEMLSTAASHRTVALCLRWGHVQNCSHSSGAGSYSASLPFQQDIMLDWF